MNRGNLTGLALPFCHWVMTMLSLLLRADTTDSPGLAEADVFTRVSIKPSNPQLWFDGPGIGSASGTQLARPAQRIIAGKIFTLISSAGSREEARLLPGITNLFRVPGFLFPAHNRLYAAICTIRPHP